MPTTTPTILDQINAEKTKVSERLARLDADRATIATELIDLDTAERVLTRVSQTRDHRSATAQYFNWFDEPAAGAEAPALRRPDQRSTPPLKEDSCAL